MTTREASPRATELTVRPARLADLDDLVEIYLSSARHHVALDAAYYEVPDPAAALARLRGLLGRRGDGFEYLVAEADGRVVGSLTISRMDDPSGGSMVARVATAEVGIAVHEGERGRGVGRALMGAAERWAAGHAIGRIVLDVNAANERALSFYRRLGYAARGIYLDKEVSAGDVS